MGKKVNEIVIKVWRGIVTEVYASDLNTIVTVIDEDVVESIDEETDEVAFQNDDTPLPEHRVYF